MLAFVDESGDAGLKLDRGSSRLFVVVMVTFSGADEARRCEERIDALRSELSLPPSYEFHFSHNSRRVRTSFLDAVRPFPFRIHVLAVDKARLPADAEARSPERLYQLAVRELCEDAAPHLQGATVIVDRSGTRQGRNDLAVYLRRRLGSEAHGAIRKLRNQRSEGHNLLQLADYVVGVAAKALNGNAEGLGLRETHLRHKVVTWRVWP
ncbi:MAG: DUF3800 domain-containing protein [Chloroflexota bacterium]|nr:DUF3800 domain-containing protein [Chloroflexota bacterium]